MNFSPLRASPAHAHVTPYLVLLVLTMIQESFQGPLRYWFYLLKMIVGLWCIWEVRALAPEARWAFSWEALVVGVLICVIWVGLDPYYPKPQLLVKSGRPWNPFKQFGEYSAAGWFFAGVRILGSALVVPPIEEAFYRSFLYRYRRSAVARALAVAVCHIVSLRFLSLPMAGGDYLWAGLSVAGDSEKSYRTRHNRARDHKFFARRLGCLERRLEFLVRVSRS